MLLWKPPAFPQPFLTSVASKFNFTPTEQRLMYLGVYEVSADRIHMAIMRWGWKGFPFPCKEAFTQASRETCQDPRQGFQSRVHSQQHMGHTWRRLRAETQASLRCDSESQELPVLGSFLLYELCLAHLALSEALLLCFIYSNAVSMQVPWAWRAYGTDQVFGLTAPDRLGQQRPTPLQRLYFL